MEGKGMETAHVGRCRPRPVRPAPYLESIEFPDHKRGCRTIEQGKTTERSSAPALKMACEKPATKERCCFDRQQTRERGARWLPFRTNVPGERRRLGR